MGTHWGTLQLLLSSLDSHVGTRALTSAFFLLWAHWTQHFSLSTLFLISCCFTKRVILILNVCFLFMCAYVCLYFWLMPCVCVWGYPQWVLVSLEMELQAVVLMPSLRAGSELRTSGRAVSALNPEHLSSPPRRIFSWLCSLFRVKECVETKTDIWDRSSQQGNKPLRSREDLCATHYIVIAGI